MLRPSPNHVTLWLHNDDDDAKMVSLKCCVLMVLGCLRTQSDPTVIQMAVE